MANNFKTIYVLKFNNYYNRILKHYDTLAEYLSIAPEYEAYININFNPGNGVSTEQILNQSTVAIDEMDYVLVVEPTYSTIESRWFILQTDRTRLGQYNLSLKRDIVADNYNDLLEAPMFVEKANVGIGDSAIFNNEDMDFNEIKTKETLLSDYTNIPWIAVYVANQETPEAITGSITIGSETADFDLHTISHSAWSLLGTKYGQPSAFHVGIAHYKTNTLTTYKKVFTEYSEREAILQRGSAFGLQLSTKTVPVNYSELNFQALKSSATQTYGWISSADEDTLSQYDGHTIQFSDGIYKCSVVRTANKLISNIEVASGLYAEFKAQIEAILNSKGISYTFHDTSATELVYAERTQYVVALEQVQSSITATYNFPATRNHLVDAPYDLIMIPYGKVGYYYQPEGAEDPRTFYTDKELNYNIAQDMARRYSGSKKVLDIQIVPYFPMPEKIVLGHAYKIDLTRLSASDYNIITGSDSSILGVGFNIKKSAFTNRITASCGDETIATTNEQFKEKILCDKYRVCSPNYAGVFEFNNIKAGYISDLISFDVDCTYMPYNPYIHVCPVFKGQLYGGDYNDIRGLVCGGDFGMAMSSDQWLTYQQQNKNYQASFDRQIQNLEVQQKYQKINDIAGAIAGAAGAAVNGASTAAKNGGSINNMYSYGVIAGSASLAAGMADVAINDKLRKETLDYTMDQFGYQLGNIKALPNSLSRTTAYTYNNKYFPFVEYYTCTDIEKEALKNKIKYNGMTIMRVGTIEEFIKPTETYIKGKLIRLDNFPGNTQEVQSLASELNQGLFIKGE